MTTSPSAHLTARDIMQCDLIVVRRGDSLQEAMSLITENHVTGLPVVDSKDRCIGLISATDILNFEQEHTEYTAEANANLAWHYDPDTGRWESVRVTTYALEEFAEVRIEHIMATYLVSVLPDAPLSEVARTMIHEKIHRVLVIDEDQNLHGIVSALDFVRHYAECDSVGLADETP
jgi:CBS domain-containing protein